MQEQSQQSKFNCCDCYCLMNISLFAGGLSIGIVGSFLHPTGLDGDPPDPGQPLSYAHVSVLLLYFGAGWQYAPAAVSVLPSPWRFPQTACRKHRYQHAPFYLISPKPSEPRREPRTPAVNGPWSTPLSGSRAHPPPLPSRCR